MVQLTEKELAVLKLVSEGDSYNEISDKLYVTRAAVSKRMSCIFSKLNAKNQLAAVSAGFRYGILK